MGSTGTLGFTESVARGAALREEIARLRGHYGHWFERKERAPIALLSDTAVPVDETAYLLSTVANREALEEALAQADAREFWTGSLVELAAELGIDLDADDE